MTSSTTTLVPEATNSDLPYALSPSISTERYSPLDPDLPSPAVHRLANLNLTVAPVPSSSPIVSHLHTVAPTLTECNQTFNRAQEVESQLSHYQTPLGSESDHHESAFNSDAIDRREVRESMVMSIGGQEYHFDRLAFNVDEAENVGCFSTDRSSGHYSL